MSPAIRSSRSGLRRGLLALGCLALLVSAYGLIRHNNWYLASDQAAFLTMARDLRSGTVFHDETIFTETVPHQWHWKTYDALQQTYFLRDGELYSRYPPGFPLLLAAAGAVGGETGEHWLNPALYLFTLVILAALLGSVWRDDEPLAALGAGVLSLWLVLLVPAGVHLWGITVARDLPAHGLGLLAVLLAVRGRAFGSGLALGAAALIRPDALLYASSLLGVAVWRPPARRAIVSWGLALGLGLLPLLAYNFATQGHPFAFTQGGEFLELWSWVLPDNAHASGELAVAVSGGGFRLSHLASTLPGNLRLLQGAFGALLVLTVVGCVWAARRAPGIVAALLPYPLVAILFYSCWVHPDSRYLTGASLCLLGLTAVGGVVIARFFQQPALGWVGHGLGLLLGIGLVWWEHSGQMIFAIAAPGPVFTSLFIAAVLVGVIRRWLQDAAGWAVLAPSLALALLAMLPMLVKSPGWGSFRRPEQLAARHYVREHVPPGSFLLADPSLGRPAENLRVHAGIEAFYPAEFALLDTNSETAAFLALIHGRRVFRLVDGRDVLPHVAIPGMATQTLVDFVPQSRAREIFADPRRVPFGVRLYEWSGIDPVDQGP